MTRLLPSPPWQRPRHLTCFYCGRRSSTTADSRVRQFVCASCEATNYLDENGDITDPPTSMTAAPAGVDDRFVDGLGSPASVGSVGSIGSIGSRRAADSVFCATCLKNQHLFVSSLAQYLPADPQHPDSPELERQYFRFRRRLEQRYPQVCAACEPRVLDRIRAAGYTAKTDHLRRMVDYSRQVRRTRATPLDVAHALGRRLWWAALLLQLLWHAAALGGFWPWDDADADDDAHATAYAPPPSLAAVSHTVAPLLRLLVAHAARLPSLCLAATVASCWWNPFLVPTVRGFTKPLTGIPTWYVYQAAILLTRVLLARVTAGDHPSDDRDKLPPTTAGAHAVAALFVLYLYAVAPRAIKKDVRPLFTQLPETPLTPQRRAANASASPSSAHDRRRGLETLSDALAEIATASPRAKPRGLDGLDDTDDADDADGWDGWQPSRRRPPGSAAHADGLDGSVNGGYPMEAADDAYAEEMDWTPTQPTAAPLLFQQSPYRAFSTYDPGSGSNPFGPRASASTSARSAFGQTPVEADRGPFWYKVPPPPASLAQRVMNRPNAPRLVQQQQQQQQQQQPQKQTPVSFFGRDGGSRASAASAASAFSAAPAAASSAVEFARPSFFAEDLQKATRSAGSGGDGDDDPGRFLSDLFSQTFSLSGAAGGDDGSDDSDNADGADADVGAHRVFVGTADKTAEAAKTSQPRRSAGRRLPSLLATLASLAVVYFLRQGMDDAADEGSAADEGLDAASIDPFPYVQPYARAIEAATVALCATLALSRTRESAQRWRRARVRARRLAERQARTQKAGVGAGSNGQASRPPTMLLAQVAAALGCLVGLASMGLAGWVALQMWTAQSTVAPAAAVAMPGLHASAGGFDEADGLPQPADDPAASLVPPALPWAWWQLAALHGAVLVHQLWLAATGANSTRRPSVRGGR